MHITHVTKTSRWLFIDLYILRWNTALIEAVFQSLPCSIKFRINYNSLTTVHP